MFCNKWGDGKDFIDKKSGYKILKYINRIPFSVRCGNGGDFQQFGIWLAEEMEDYKNRGMWIRLAKINHRSVLEQCLSFVKDSNADNKIALFLWKLKEIKNQKPDLKPDDKSFQK